MHSLPKLLVVLLFFSLHLNGFSQLRANISIELDNQPISVFISTLEADYGLKFYYKAQWISDKYLSGTFSDAELQFVLKELLASKELVFIARSPNMIILLPDVGASQTPRSVDGDSRSTVSIGKIQFGNREGILSGYVINGRSELPLSGTVITIEGRPDRFLTKTDGSFEIPLLVGDHLLKFHHPTMVDYQVPIAFNSDGSLLVNMFEDVTVLDEIVISTQAVDANVSSVLSGQEILEIETIKTIPAFFGEADIISSILNLPGVNQVGEGSAGINVRGGGVGQNLVSIDNAIVYNPSHLFGFFSAFNPDVVDRVNFYKGVIPADYGGRLSSILDVAVSNGDKERLTGSGGIGLINSRVMLKGPIKKDTSSFLVAGRAAYPSYLLRNLDDIDLSSSRAFFGDANMKFDQLLNEKNRISVNAYLSRDRFDFSDQLEYDYGNRALGATWKGQIASNLFTETGISYSSYDYTFSDVLDASTASNLDASLDQYSLRSKFSLEDVSSKTSFGLDVNSIAFEPGNYTQGSEVSTITPLTIPKESGLEMGAYVDNETFLSDQLSVYGGLRFSLFDGGRSGLDATYYGLEPRVSVNYKLGGSSSVKLGYNRMRQYTHFISNTTNATPIDLWKLSNQSIKPQIGDQLTLGYFQNLRDNAIETSVEAFYKRTKDLIEYRNGADLFLNPELEQELIQGQGRAYGIEFMVKKKEGKLNGWVNYTFSRSLIRVEDAEAINTINNGDYFPTNFDQPHNMNVFANLKVTRRFSINTNFTYNTGRPISYPESVYQVRGIKVADFAERNAYRIPNYHRLDLSFVLGTTLKREKAIEANWSFSIYNVYGRRNAYSVYFKNDEISGEPEAFKLSILARPIVAVSYNFKF